MLSQGKPAIAQAPKALPNPGDVVDGKYRIERVIGEGGMGRVYAAHHEVLDQRVAIKLLFAEVAERPNVVERFLREAKAAARLKSDHVARVMDAGMAENGLPFIVMECLDGADLMELIQLNGPMAPVEVVDIMLQALEAIAHAHAAEIVHRDLKPSNIFLSLAPDGSNIVKILDFGIAKSISALGAEVATLTGQNIMGSPAYMSPEQIRNARTVDTRSDIWSLGVVMYELITGKLPFAGEGIGELLAAVLEQAPIPARQRKPDVSEALEKVISRALKRNKDQRYPTAAAFARDLQPHASPRWAPLADRIEGILANGPRSMSLTGGITAQQIAAAASAANGGDAIETVESPDDAPGSGQRATAAPKSSERRRLLIAAVAGAVVVAGVGLLAQRLRPNVEQAKPPASVAAPSPPPTASAHAASVEPALEFPAAEEAPPASSAIAAAPSAPFAPAASGKGMIGAKPGRPAARPPDKPVRPKVLHSRE